MTTRTAPTKGYVTEYGDYLHPRGRGGGIDGWYHAAIDIHPTGPRTVVAPEDGRVVEVGRGTKGTGRGGYGPWVVCILGESGYYHWLAHVDHCIVGPSARVRAGQPVAQVSMDLAHPHVHWEVRTRLRPHHGRKPWTVTIDPVCWLAQGEGCPTGPEWIQLSKWVSKKGPWARRKHEMTIPDDVRKVGPNEYVLPDIELTLDSEKKNDVDTTDGPTNARNKGEVS